MITSAEGRPVKEKVSRYKTSDLSRPHRPAHHDPTQRRQPIFQGVSKGGLRGRAAILDGSSRSEVPTAIPLWQVSKGRSPFVAGLERAFYNALPEGVGRAAPQREGVLFHKILLGRGASSPTKRKEFYFIKSFWGCGAEPLSGRGAPRI